MGGKYFRVPGNVSHFRACGIGKVARYTNFNRVWIDTVIECELPVCLCMYSEISEIKRPRSLCIGYS